MHHGQRRSVVLTIACISRRLRRDCSRPARKVSVDFNADTSRRPLVLLDRDGVINAESPTFIKSTQEWRPLPGSIEAIAKLHAAGYLIGVCTNQSAIGRGLLTSAGLARIHAELERRVIAKGGQIARIRYCPHLPEDGCACRKPLPGMLNDLLTTFGGERAETYFVGDSERDVRAALAARCRPALVRPGNGAAAEKTVRALGVDEVYADLAAFALRQLTSGNTAR